MGCCEGIAKCMLIGINVVFAIFGVIFLGLGIFLRFYADTVWNLITPLLDSVLSTLGMSSSDITFGSFNIISLLEAIGIPLLVLGCLLLGMSIIGAFGACCKSKMMLLLYIILVVIMLLAKLIFTLVIALDWSTYRGQLVTYLQTSITNDFQGLNGTSMFSLVWNFAQYSFYCCGVTDYTDNQLATQWVRTGTYTASGVSFSYTLTVPVSCCVMSSGFTPADAQGCFTSTSASNAYIETPCMNSIDGFLSQYSLYLILFVVALLGFELLLIIFAVCVCKPLWCTGDKVSPED